ncbi:MAG: hypothetical protein C5B49_12230 [Bdellovibrio sp.]|nr:MAG: hypothetical protein C5B49_12230 [Bdellovibrio sp.]
MKSSGQGIFFHRVAEKSTLAEWLTGAGYEQFLHLCPFGAVYLNHQRVSSLDQLLEPGDILRLHTQPRRFIEPAEPVERMLIAETKDFLIVNKPAGFPVHATVDNLFENCASWFARQLGERLWATHRLDVGTEGLLVLARSTRARDQFHMELQQRGVRKKYSALVPPQLTPFKLTKGEELRHWMKSSDRAPRELSNWEKPGWKICLAKVLDFCRFERATEISLELLTGRTHQLRTQLAQLGLPVLGDAMYGSKENWDPPGGWALRATALRFSGGEFTLPRWNEADFSSRCRSATCRTANSIVP